MMIRNTKDTKDTKDTKAFQDTKACPTMADGPGRPFLKPNETSYKVIGCALRVHTACGPGGLEAAIAPCLGQEMRDAGLFVEEEVTLPLIYKKVRMPESYRADFIVEKCLVVEVKCVSHVLAVHRAQLLNYLRQSGLMLGLLLNFNVPHMRNGIHRIINGPERDL
jgi:GxxExxY protein